MLFSHIYDNCVIYRYKAKPTSKIFVGSFQLKDKGDNYEIWCLSVHGRCRNKGYGTKMLTEFLAEFKHDKPLILYVYKTNTIAIRLYAKVGFVICGEYPFGNYAWEMKYGVKS